MQPYKIPKTDNKEIMKWTLESVLQFILIFPNPIQIQYDIMQVP